MAARSQEVGQFQSKSLKRLELADVGVLQSPLQAATGTFLLFPVDQGGDPGLPCHLAPVREQAVPPQRAGALAQDVWLRHRHPP
jgi:hypothetical protein